MFCSNCGNEVPDDAKVCPECGQDLSYESQEIRHQKKKKRRGGRIAAVIITCIIIAAVFEGLWIFGPLDKMLSGGSSQKSGGTAPQNGGVTALVSENAAAEADSVSEFSLLSGEEPTPTPTVTPVAQLPEVSASEVATPTPTPTPEPTSEPSPSPSAEPTPSVSANSTAGTDSSYILPGSDTNLITTQQLSSMDTASIRLARNEIYARHGLIFKSKDLQDYFSKKSWYHGTVANATDIQLSDTEKKNLSTINAYEASLKK